MALAPSPADLDDLSAFVNSLPADIDAGHTALLDRPVARKMEILGGLGIVGHTTHLVEVHSESFGEQQHAVAEDAGTLLGNVPKIWLIDGVTEPHRYFCRRRVVDGGVSGFQHGNLIHPVRQPSRHDGEQLDETWVDATAENR